MYNPQVWGATNGQLKVYYFLVLISLFFLLYRYKKNGFYILIILLFFPGLFAFAGKNYLNVYRIFLTFLALYWLIKTRVLKQSKQTLTIFSFAFFSITFFLTSFASDDYTTIVFSQYSRFFLLFVMFLVLNKIKAVPNITYWIEKVIYEILIVQILLAILKFIIIGPTESVVGSISFDGGGVATTLPILGFIFLWIKKHGKFDKKDWYFTIGLILIGFVSLKRAIWFIMPIVIGLLIFYVPKRKIPERLAWISIIFIPLIIYFGFRLDPTLNSEGKVWGSFNLKYAIEYAETYSFGNNNNQDKAAGRGGATLLVFKKFTSKNLNAYDWWGRGLRYMYATNYGEFDTYDFGINHKGNATGIFQTMLTNGIIGIIATLFFVLSMILQTKNPRLRLVLLSFFLWDYMLYSALVWREPGLSFLLVYAVVLASKDPGKMNST